MLRNREAGRSCGDVTNQETLKNTTEAEVRELGTEMSGEKSKN